MTEISGSEEAKFARDLRSLRVRAIVDLERAEEERRRLQRLIAFIDDFIEDPHPSPPRARSKRRRPPPPAEPLLDVIQQRPGVRASMLALVSGREVDDVLAELHEHELAEKVERQGLGWRIAEDSSSE